jgi:hypothetical protein
MKKQNLIITKLLSRLFFPKYTTRFIQELNDLINRNGIPFMIKYMKQSKLHITRYISGKPLLVNTSLVSLTDGFPTRFLYLKKVLDSSNKGKMFVLTLFSYTRFFKDNKGLVNTSYESITLDRKSKYTIPGWFIKEWVHKNNLRLTYSNDWDTHYFSVKSSPNGQATISGNYGLFTMIHIGHGLLQSILGIMGKSIYDRTMRPAIELVMKNHNSFYLGKPILGSIAIVNDPEYKKRPIAMIDYYSQWTLRPIHEGLLSLLKRFPCDRTYTQDPFHNWGKTLGNKFWSLDLSSATDRFPIDLQEKLISFIYDNKELASSWKSLLIDRDYITPEGKPIRYSVGQPMGAYSSWAAFTITHHLVVSWAAHLCGTRDFTKYIILGDDIVINNDKIAQKYIGIMTRLGVDISEAKTHVSKNTYEFAKRWIHHGTEISGLPLGGILSNVNSFTTIINIIVTWVYRVNFPLNGTTRDLLYYCLKGIKMRNRYVSNKTLWSIIDSSIFVIRYNSKIATYEEIRLYFSKYLTIDELNVPKDNPYRFIDRVFSIGLMTFSEQSVKHLKDYSMKIRELFPLLDPEHLRDHNIIHSIYNKLAQMKRRLIALSSDEEFDLVDCISDMRVDSPDKLLMKVRNKPTEMIFMDRIWRMSIRKINSITEHNLINYVFDPDSILKNGYSSYYIDNLSQELYVLDQIRCGYYGKEQTLQFW